jgi:histidinol phosphatase-like enzyme
MDLAQSYMIGDKLIDLECGWNAGVKQSILVRTGYGASVAAGLNEARAVIVDDLPAAVKWILNSH